MKTKAGDSKNIVWWEKSVEYTFIAEMVSRKMFVWAAPLGGNAESALADAVMNWDDDLLLIEFKRDVDSLKSEYKKYTLETDDKETNSAYEIAKVVMCKHKGVGGHGLIYGDQKDGKLLLRAIPYWDTNDAIDALKWCDESGVSANAFDEYLVALSAFRFATSDTSGGSSGSRSFVVGVGKEGKQFTLELEVYENLRPKLKLALEVKANLRTGLSP
ncbi:MAG: hypothetical protein ABI478_07450 [Propionivibrio sp.]